MSELSRLQLEGDCLILTERFDPRIQREAQGELLRTVEGLLSEKKELLLDLTRCEGLPSMLLAVLVEAHSAAARAGCRLRLRTRASHLRGFNWSGFARLFRPSETAQEQADEDVVEYEAV